MRYLLLALAAGGCAIDPSATISATGDACGGELVETPLLDSPHHAIGTPLAWPTNPPTSGPHWALWAKWDRHYVGLDRGAWLHNAEHGGVVFAYRCDAGCPETLAALVRLVRELPEDPRCDPSTRRRALIVEDPRLPEDHTVAAIAWGVAYTARCVDDDSLTAFYAAWYGRAGESTCADGASLFGGTPLA